MSHIEAAQEAVLRVYGKGHEDVAACAAVAARSAVVDELDQWRLEQLNGFTATFRKAKEALEADHRHTRAYGEDLLASLLEEMEAACRTR